MTPQQNQDGEAKAYYLMKLESPKKSSYMTWSKEQLKEACKGRRLPISGKNWDLISRLKKWDKENQILNPQSIPKTPARRRKRVEMETDIEANEEEI